MQVDRQSASAPLLQPFYPALDGLRTLAFVAVFAYHCGISFRWEGMKWQGVRWGWVGVELFFVLSGFLITGILSDTLHRPRYLRHFYVRRALRIFPLYFAFWTVVFLLTPILHVEWNRYVVSMVFYFGNFFLPGWRLGLHASPAAIVYHSLQAPHDPRVIGVEHFWTLCIEEQFYLIWPAMVAVFSGGRRLLRITAIALCLCPAVRLIYLRNHIEMLSVLKVYHTTWFHLDGLLAGACVALWLRQTTLTSMRVRNFAYGLLTLPVLLFVIFIRSAPDARFEQNDIVVNTIGYSLIALSSCGLLLLSIDPMTRIAKLLSFGPLAAMGRVTYGLYFFHLILIDGMHGSVAFLGVHVPWAFVVLLTTILVAWLSFRFLESPFLRLKDVFAPRPGGVSDPPPVGNA